MTCCILYLAMSLKMKFITVTPELLLDIWSMSVPGCGGSYRLTLVYFQKMLSIVDAISAAQGFSERVHQYKQMKRLPNGLVCKTLLVKHYLTQELYELKTIKKD